jgi:diguanylate cyclase (GGDEF)-like protein
MDGRFLALYRLGHLLNANLRENNIFEIAARELAASWPGYNCHVAKLNNKEQFDIIVSSSNNLLEKLNLGSAITENLVQDKKPVIINNTIKDKRLSSDFLNSFYLKSVLLAPVLEKERTSGLILMESNKLRDFNNGEVALIMLAASQMGTSLENAKLYRRMEKLARFDELTNIYNRRAFQEVVEAELVQSRQKTSRLSLVMVDIDFFKQVNDRYGHQMGDQVLAQVAELIKQNLRAEDSVARFGGEEFVIILPGADCRTALQVAERARRAMEGANWPDGQKITFSAGVASYPDDGEKLADLLQSADRALYSAKSGGRNQVRHASGLRPDSQTKVC